MSLDLGGVFKCFSEADVPGQMHALVGSPSPIELLKNLSKMYSGKSMQGANITDGACQNMTVEILGHELLSPIIDGEYYRNVKKIAFKNGPSLRIPKLRSNR